MQGRINLACVCVWERERESEGVHMTENGGLNSSRCPIDLLMCLSPASVCRLRLLEARSSDTSFEWGSIQVPGLCGGSRGTGSGTETWGRITVLPGLQKEGQHEGWGVCSDGVCVSVGVMEVVVEVVGGCWWWMTSPLRESFPQPCTQRRPSKGRKDEKE